MLSQTVPSESRVKLVSGENSTSVDKSRQSVFQLPSSSAAVDWFIRNPTSPPRSSAVRKEVLACTPYKSTSRPSTFPGMINDAKSWLGHASPIPPRSKETMRHSALTRGLDASQVLVAPRVPHSDPGRGAFSFARAVFLHRGPGPPERAPTATDEDRSKSARTSNVVHTRLHPP